MCGIAGAINFKLSHSRIDADMLHRGPDEQQGFTSGNVDLYHLRLAILDISGGHQPMHLDGRYTIVFNGQVYNHQELRQQCGLTGTTASDTETLLLLYRKYGPAFLDRVDGMFAFAIYDRSANTIFIARDRAGKKPLYYYKDHEKLVFASELNCLKGLLPLEIEWDNLYHYLRLGSFYKRLTPYKKVHELPAGHYLQIDCSNLEVREQQWWNIRDFYAESSPDGFRESLQKTDALLHQAVKRRLESSDLEVGCFLSGGIDSGLVTAIASEYSRSLKTFTVSFTGAYDEAPLAKAVAEKYHTDHTAIKISFNSLKTDLEKIVGNYGEPFFDSSAIPSYYVSQAAKQHVTVILNGDGADELFGGYRRYVPFARYDFFKSNVAVKTAASIAEKLLPNPKEKRSVYNYAYRLASFASKNSLEIYLSAGVDILEGFEKHLLQPPSTYLDQMRADFEAIVASPISGLKKLMNMDFETSLAGQLLVKMDIASMANSLEGRSPFLSKELLAYAPGLDDSFKIRGSTTKYLLRELAKKYLPAELIGQPKRGFEVPLKHWVNGELREMVHDYVGGPSALSPRLLEPAFIRALLGGKLRIAAEKRAKILWMLTCLEIWYTRNR